MVETAQSASILGRFQYDFDGRRNKKIGEEGVRQYVYDQTSIFLEYDDTGQQVARYEYGSDHLVSVVRRDEPRRFYSLDGLRSVVNLTDDSGASIARYHLDAWGNFRFPAELSTSKNRFAFTGYLWDPETGLFNAKARYFDPRLGRFLSQDSFLGQIDEPPSLHRYCYGNANPLRFIDPTGHQAQSVAPEVDEKEAMLRDAKATLEQVERANPQLTGVAGDVAVQGGTPVTVTEDDGLIAAGWRKLKEAAASVSQAVESTTQAIVGSVGDQVEVATKKALAPDPARQSRSAELRAATADTLAEQAASRLAERDIARQFQETGAEVTRAGAEKGTRLAVETAETELGIRAATLAVGAIGRGAASLSKGTLSAAEANAPHLAAGRRPPYASGTRAREIVLSRERTLVRVHGEGNQARSWLMRAEEVEGLSAAEIRDKFALPEMPKYLSDVQVPAGTRMRVGRVGEQPGWGVGGGMQYELLDRLSETAFTNRRPLK
jgi:RHS repeat-associated protein